ncbi:MAG TPA: pyruvate kinase [Spongiibacteraceae bacterium]|nr:pyruvate kinase [Spongiibacteraceae bacterium]
MNAPDTFAPDRTVNSDRAVLIEKAIAAVQSLYDEMMRVCDQSGSNIGDINPVYRASALNLQHYLTLRRHDLRELQRCLAELGLSSLGRAEAHTLATLEAVLRTLYALAGQAWQPATSNIASPAYCEGQQLLATHTQLLLGRPPKERSVHIMVTMPSEAATDYTLVHDLLQHGMTCMRINCAYDDENVWQQMIDNLRRAEQATAKSCKVLMDLAGPKLRTGPLQPGPQVLKIKPLRNALGRMIAPARIWLTAEGNEHLPPAPATAVLPVPAAWLAQLQEDDVIAFIDARGAERNMRVLACSERGCWAELEKTAYVIAGIELRREQAPKHEPTAGVIGQLPESENAILLRKDDTLIVTRDLAPGRAAVYDEHGRLLNPAVIGCTLPAAFDHLKVGEPVWLDDGKLGGHIEKIESDCIHLRIGHVRVGGAKLRSDKGINFPDSELRLPALTEEDKKNLKFVMQHADIVSLSFANSREDVELLLNEMAHYKNREVGFVLKIETQRGFFNLPAMVLAAMKSSACGIMIARGDLAVECGFERLAEVQEEILWICEAAHMPVIWATQVLESLAKSGMPSRAEVTDAAMATRAECVMLNKGPYIVDAVKALDDILRRMRAHHSKKSAMLRELKLAHMLHR